MDKHIEVILITVHSREIGSCAMERPSYEVSCLSIYSKSYWSMHAIKRVDEQNAVAAHIPSIG